MHYTPAPPDPKAPAVRINLLSDTQTRPTPAMREAMAKAEVGDEQVVGSGGQVLVVPGLVAHRFEVLEGGTYNATHIHANDRFVTEWLEPASR